MEEYKYRGTPMGMLSDQFHMTVNIPLPCGCALSKSVVGAPATADGPTPEKMIDDGFSTLRWWATSAVARHVCPKHSEVAP